MRVWVRVFNIFVNIYLSKVKPLKYDFHKNSLRQTTSRKDVIVKKE